MDLLHKRVEQSQVTPLCDDTIHVDFDNEATRSEPCFDVIEGRNCDIGIELGFESESSVVEDLSDSDINVDNNNVDDFDEPDHDDFFFDRRGSGLDYRDISSIGSDLRLINVESGSDDDGTEIEREVWGIDLSDEDVYVDDDDEEDEEDDDDVSVTIPLCLHSVHLEDLGVTADWEEVDGGGVVDEREIRIGFAEVDGGGVEDDGEIRIGFAEVDDGGVADEREMRSGFAEVEFNEESSVFAPPLISLETLVTRERAVGSGNRGWEVLLDSHTLEINLDVDNRELYVVGDHDDYIQTTEYEMLFEQFAEAETSIIGLPPTSKSFLKNLPMVELKLEKYDDGVVCAVCKDEMDIKNKAVQLPCNHKYHSECIVPWLKVRNTCPVCRHELPTDEQRKSQTTTTSYDILL